MCVFRVLFLFIINGCTSYPWSWCFKFRWIRVNCFQNFNNTKQLEKLKFSRNSSDVHSYTERMFYGFRSILVVSTRNWWLKFRFVSSIVTFNAFYLIMYSAHAFCKYNINWLPAAMMKNNNCLTWIKPYAPRSIIKFSILMEEKQQLTLNLASFNTDNQWIICNFHPVILFTLLYGETTCKQSDIWWI